MLQGGCTGDCCSPRILKIIIKGHSSLNQGSVLTGTGTSSQTGLSHLQSPGFVGCFRAQWHQRTWYQGLEEAPGPALAVQNPRLSEAQRLAPGPQGRMADERQSGERAGPRWGGLPLPALPTILSCKNLACFNLSGSLPARRSSSSSGRASGPWFPRELWLCLGRARSQVGGANRQCREPGPRAREHSGPLAGL